MLPGRKGSASALFWAKRLESQSTQSCESLRSQHPVPGVGSFLRLFLGAMLLLLTGAVTAQTQAGGVLMVAPQQDRLSLNRHIEFLLDPDGNWSLREALASNQWRVHSENEVLNFGFTDETAWLKTTVRLPPDATKQWLLVIPYPLLEQVEVYLLDVASNQPLYQLDGENASAAAATYYQSFALPNNREGPMRILVRAKSTTSLQVPLEIWSQEYLAQRQVMETLYWGLYFGFLLALIAYNSFLFTSVRDVAYLYYVMYLIAIGVVMFSISGLGKVYLGQLSDFIPRYSLPVGTGFASLWALLFARSFLHWQGFPAKLDRTMGLGALCALALVGYAWFEPALGAQLSGWMGGIAISLVIVAGVSAWRGGVIIARYFVMAWAAFALGALLYLLNIFGLIPVSRISNHAIQVGSALDAVLLSFALAHRIKEERSQKLAAMRQRHAAEQQMKQLHLQALEQAMHDPATRMPNDSLLVARLQELLQAEPSLNRPFALVLLYFPQVREIASSLGRGLAESLMRRLVRDFNQVLIADGRTFCIEARGRAHLAVTEFASLAFICHASDQEETSLRAPIEQLLAHFDTPVDIGSVAMSLDVFCGIAQYPAHGDRADLLVQHAGSARDLGLRRGERVVLYNSEMDVFGRRRLVLMGALSRAIREGELELYMQPQLECDSLRLVGAEILLRWRSPKHGAVPTTEFIEIAESAGLMNHLTRYVVREAMAVLSSLNRNGLRLSLSINLSVQNLIEPDFVDYILESASRYQINLRDIVLEVTETSLIEKISTVIDNLERLAAAGCSIALDDFGTGYSSLAYLSRLPITELKIDRSFIMQMSESLSDFRIVENTVKLARTLAMQTVAEGVEDSVMLDTVVQLGCTRVQGYYVGKPMPADQFYDWAQRKVG